jgi:hypothetical protein
MASPMKCFSIDETSSKLSMLVYGSSMIIYMLLGVFVVRTLMMNHMYVVVEDEDLCIVSDWKCKMLVLRV